MVKGFSLPLVVCLKKARRDYVYQNNFLCCFYQVFECLNWIFSILKELWLFTTIKPSVFACEVFVILGKLFSVTYVLIWPSVLRPFWYFWQTPPKSNFKWSLIDLELSLGFSRQPLEHLKRYVFFPYKRALLI